MHQTWHFVPFLFVWSSRGDTGRWELSCWGVESLLHRDGTVHFPCCLALGLTSSQFHSGSSFPKRAASISHTLVLDLTKTALSHSLGFSCDWALLLHPPVGAGVLSLRRGALHVPLSQEEEQCPRRCSWALLLVDLRHNLGSSLHLFICRLKMTLSSRGCQSWVIINVFLNALRPPNYTKEG